MTGIVDLGDYSDIAVQPTLSGVELELRALELVAHWGRCGLTADWLARFFSYDFALGTREGAVSLLSTVVNELLENAVKFCSDKQEGVRIEVRHHGGFLRIETRNTTGMKHVGTLRATLGEMAREPLDQLFARRVQTQAAPGSSGIGLLILTKDYGARLGIRLTPQGGEWEVRVRVDLDVDELEQT